MNAFNVRTAHQEAMKKEIERLKKVYEQQQPRNKAVENTTDLSSEPEPEP